MRGCFVVCGWFALCLALFGFGWIRVRGLARWWLGYRVVWLAWFGLDNRVVYEVRSGRGIAGLSATWSGLYKVRCGCVLAEFDLGAMQSGYSRVMWYG